ncbi:MAG: MBL fold metallo-hydrolase [Bryobacteraceae bacterium]
MPDSVAMIRSSVESLGFKFGDIKILTATHAHSDHLAGMAEMKKITGAKMYMSEADTPMIEDGGSTDYRYPKGRGKVYEPVKVDQRLKDGDKIRLGGVELVAYHHPGHTKGSTSFTMTVAEAGKNYRVGIVNMGSINPGVKVGGMRPSRRSHKPTRARFTIKKRCRSTYGWPRMRRSSRCTTSSSRVSRTTRIATWTPKVFKPKLCGWKRSTAINWKRNGAGSRNPRRTSI